MAASDQTEKLLQAADAASRGLSRTGSYGQPNPKPKLYRRSVFAWIADCWVSLLAILIILGFLGSILFALMNSDSDTKKRSEFMVDCQRHGFALGQCDFLYALAADADDTADQTAVVAGAALGIAAASVAASSK